MRERECRKRGWEGGGRERQRDGGREKCLCECVRACGRACVRACVRKCVWVYEL